MSDAPTPTALNKEVRVRCTPAHAFDIFTRRVDLWWPRSHRRFEGSTLTLEPRPGGRFMERSAAGEVALLGEVLEADPPQRLAYTWAPGGHTGPTLVEVRFTAEGEGTRVQIRHSAGQSGLGDLWPERVQRFDRAWTEVLPAFAAAADAPGPEPSS